MSEIEAVQLRPKAIPIEALIELIGSPTYRAEGFEHYISVKRIINEEGEPRDVSTFAILKRKPDPDGMIEIGK
jgi:hypothetical protein